MTVRLGIVVLNTTALAQAGVNFRRADDGGIQERYFERCCIHTAAFICK